MQNFTRTGLYRKQDTAQLLKILVVECNLYAIAHNTFLRIVEPIEGSKFFDIQMKVLENNIDLLTERLHELGYTTEEILSSLIDHAGNTHDFHKSNFDGIMHDLLYINEQTIKLIKASHYWCSGFTEKSIILTFNILLKNHDELIHSILLYMRKYNNKKISYKWNADAKK